MTQVTIKDLIRPTQLHHRYPTQNHSQPCFIELDCRDGTVEADWDPEIGGGVPMCVHHGIRRRYTIPCLQAKFANALMHRLKPLFQRVVDGFEIIWDGHNHVAKLSDDATDADEEIQQQCRNCMEDRDPEDCVAYWDAGDWLDPIRKELEDEITADTTDEQLDTIERRLRVDVEEGTVVAGINIVLEEIRDAKLNNKQEE